MTKSISPNKVYLNKGIDELLAQATRAKITYTNKDGLTARLEINDGEITKGSLPKEIKSQKEAEALLQSHNITYATFNDEERNYTYDTTNGKTLTIEENSPQGLSIKTFEWHDNRFRLTNETSPNNNLETVYTYNGDNVTAKQIDPNQKGATPHLKSPIPNNQGR